jgi:hypothetical protein
MLKDVLVNLSVAEGRSKAAERAKAAVAKFAAATRHEGLSAETRVVNATIRANRA